MKEIISDFIPEPITEKDWIFGVSAIDTEIKILDGNWTKYLPSEERQSREFETYACTNFNSNNAVEELFTRLIDDKLISIGNLKWLNDNGYLDSTGHINFSDRFDAIISHTDPNGGNSLKAVAEAKRKFGLIPEKMCPWVSNKTEYYDKSLITPEMYTMGLQFLARFPINYEIVYKVDFKEALKVSPIAAACFAWPVAVNGVFPKDTRPINHAINLIKPIPTTWTDFDSYSPFIKQLSSDYIFYDYGIRYIVREIADVSVPSVKKNMYKLFRDPSDPDEVYAFNEQMTAKRHIVNKETLVEGSRPTDQYWVYNEDITPIVVCTQEQFRAAVEAAEILLLPKDSQVVISTGTKTGFWAWLKSLFKN